MINLSNYSSENNDFTPSRGPIPDGSSVGVMVSVRESADYGDPAEPYILVSRSGLRRLNLTFEVMCGSYTGAKWFEAITLPEEFQDISLTSGQQKSAQIGGRQLCAIWDASHGIKAGDKSEAANAKRSFRSWADFKLLKCFVTVGIDTNNQSGKQFNVLKGVVGIGTDKFNELKEKKEIISESKPQSPAPIQSESDAFGGAGDEDIPF